MKLAAEVLGEALFMIVWKVLADNRPDIARQISQLLNTLLIERTVKMCGNPEVLPTSDATAIEFSHRP